MEKPEHTIRINPVKTAIFLLGISLLIMIFSLLGQRAYYTGNPTEKFFRQLFTTEFFVNNGENVATYWNMFILIIMAVITFAITSVKHAQKAKYRFEWWILGIIFFYFAMDELSGVTRRFASLLKNLPDMQGGFLYNWLYPVAAAIIILLVIFFIWFYLHSDMPNKFLFPISIIFYAVGAFRAELVSGKYGEIYGTSNSMYLYLTHAEEFVEHVGIILIIYLLLTYFATLVSEIEFVAKETEKE